jgi:hypothetical protein
MSTTVILVLLLVIVLIVGPFATLRAVSHYKARRSAVKKPAEADDPDDPDKPKGFW